MYVAVIKKNNIIHVIPLSLSIGVYASLTSGDIIIGCGGAESCDTWAAAAAAAAMECE